jgi:azurin
LCSETGTVASIEEEAIDHAVKFKDPVKNSCAALVRRPVIFGLAVLPLAGCKPRNVATVELHIASDGDQLAFKPDHLSCPTGADVRLFFHHAGQIIDDPHDWILLKPGTVGAFLADADKSPDDTAVIPANDKAMVLAATALCGKQHTVMVEFVAPAPGDYAFVCSVAGHGETMRGTLTVTA